eukprot:TRINITY_DN27349_c0_g7_i1.p2 TRINITY_DN27349_c0_g7~~TRINITY_DN27349_c0_g7_i1.p2  ORF type:complete len:188 (-),score=40.06 TRINITY_DN27349_c0_g7_i1:234-797(-)
MASSFADRRLEPVQSIYATEASIGGDAEPTDVSQCVARRERSRSFAGYATHEQSMMQEANSAAAKLPTTSLDHVEDDFSNRDSEQATAAVAHDAFQERQISIADRQASLNASENQLDIDDIGPLPHLLGRGLTLPEKHNVDDSAMAAAEAARSAFLIRHRARHGRSTPQVEGNFERRGPTLLGRIQG